MNYNNITILGGHKLALSYRDKIAQGKKDGKISFNHINCIAENPDNAILDLIFNKPINKNDVLIPDHTAKHVFLQTLMSLVAKKFPKLTSELSPFQNNFKPPFLHKSDNDAIWAMSYATWTCPPDCDEPAICPHIKDKRTWDFGKSVNEILKDVPPENSFIFPCEILFKEIACIPMPLIAKELKRFESILHTVNHQPFTVITHSHCHAILGNFRIF